MTALIATILAAVGWVGAYFWLADRREALEDRAAAWA